MSKMINFVKLKYPLEELINKNKSIFVELSESAQKIDDDKSIEIIKPLEFYEVIDLIQEIIQELSAEYTILNNVKLYEEFDESFDSPPIIVYSVDSIQPGTAGAAKYQDIASGSFTASAYTRQMTPRHRMLYKDITEPRYLTLVESYDKDYIVTFTCYSTKSYESTKLAEAFEQILLLYRPVIKEAGVPDIMFLGQEKKIQKDVAGTKYVGTPIRYLMKISKIYELKEAMLLRLRAKIFIKTFGESEKQLTPIKTKI